MWRHVEPQRLLEGTRGGMLDERETDHLVSCELCQELLIFFEEQSSTLNQSQPDDKAA
jgi:hypothetical protein